ncbi:hypothetical protein E2C01_003587 [Portunus trituberculatus]|uniref:Uncharacterized protein n=1 Tax=Portunus trituberculatus TaxID=210409 RepID=A0A5B7CMJ6_PORTR|nr:hypothetical protein [Portunus trituberculatus]
MSQLVRFDQLIRHSYLARHPSGKICRHPKFAASPPGRRVNRRYPVRRFLCLTLTPAVVQADHALPLHLLPPRCFDHAAQSHLQPQP